MSKIGILLNQHAYDLTGNRLAEVAKSIEGLGFESVWLLDSFSRDPFLAASFILANTTELKVGTGVATIYGRDAMSATQARETLSEYFPGRFFMGLGCSNKKIVEMRKGEWLPELTKMPGYLGDMTTTQLAHPKPAQLAPLYIAAHGKGLQDVAKEHAQGILTWILPAQNVKKARAQIGPTLEIIANFPCVISSDPEEARRVARAFLDFYIAIPYYQRAYKEIGFDEADFENGGSDRLIDAVVAWGEPEQIRTRMAEYSEAGATRVVINPLKASADPEAEGQGAVEADWGGLAALAPVLLKN